MRVAALDLGSNSFLLLIAEVENGHLKKILHDEVQIVRLGEGLSKNKKFSPEALKRANEALQKFSETIKKFKPQKTLAAATAAAREATNQSELLKLCENYNIPVQIISGEEEARITYLGCRAEDDLDHGLTLVVDIGGGSTELILGHGKELVRSASLPVGGVKLTEQFGQDGDKVSLHISELLREKLADWQAPSRVCGVAGTPTELARLLVGEFSHEKINDFKISMDELRFYKDELQRRSPQMRVQEMGVSPGRADIILSGICVLIEVLKFFKNESLFVSTRGVRFGVAMEAAKQ